MGLKLNPGEVKAMAASAKAAIKQYNNELKKSLSVISGVTNEQRLQGKAYAAFKFHMADHTLVVSSLIAAGDKFISGLTAISNAVGSEVLDEDKLNKCIESCERSIKTYERHIDRYQALLRDPIYYETSAGYAYSRISECRELVGYYQDLKKTMEDKLRNLFEINSDLSGIVNGMESLYNGIEAGILSLANGWNGSAFVMPEVAYWREKLLGKYKDAIYNILTQLKNNVKGRDVQKMCYSKDPVNLATGNLIYDKDDLVISGRTPFIFRRFYNSVSEYTGVLGRDFNHNYELRLDIKKDADGQVGVTIRFEDGQEDTFIRLDGENYESYYGTTGSFEAIEDKETGTQESGIKGYLYTKLDGRKYYFDREGLYTRQEDINGNGFFLEYDNDDAKLIKISKDSGEYFALSYNSEGYLSDVCDHTGRHVQYEYADDKLIKVVLSDGNAITYGYSYGGKLHTVTNPRGICVLTNMFDGEGRTIRQEFPDGSAMSYRYDDENQAVTMVERNGARSVYHHDEAYRNTKVEYPNGTEEFTYNSKNQRTKVKDRNGNETRYTYDNKGNVTGIINALGSKLTLTYNGLNKPMSVKFDGKSRLKNIYDKKGNLTEITDAMGQRTSFAYDDKGNVIKIIQADGSEIRIAYDERNNIKTLTNPDGSAVSYEYDELNRITRTTDALGNVTSYRYDINGNIKEVKNPAGRSQTFTYNESNKVIEVVGFNGAKTLYEYGPLNKPVSITNPLGNKTLLQYDSMWNLSRVTRPNGAHTAYKYDENNNLSSEEDAQGNIVGYEYDGNGNITLIEDAEGNKTLLAYDALNRLVKVTAPEGAMTQYVYDEEGNLIKVKDALGNEVNAQYDELGRITKEVNQLGASREYAYDRLGNLKKVIRKGSTDSVTVTLFEYKPGTDKVTAITYPDGSIEHYSYDANNNLVSFTDRNGYKSTYTYDALNRLTKAEGQEGDKKEYEYDAAGNVTRVTDALGNITLYAYDLNNNLVKVTDALGNETAYEYDANDELTMIRQYKGAECGDMELSGVKGGTEDLPSRILSFTEENKNCHITHYTRNTLGQIEAITDAFGNQERFRYNKRGELIAKLDKEGYLTKYVYTPSGDIAGIEYADGRSVKMSYNPLRQLEEVKDWLGVTRITNNALGQALGVIYPDGKNVSYEYDVNGNRTALTYPDGEKISYFYDELGRLSRLENDDHEVAYRYDTQSNLIEKAFSNGVKTTYAYNGRGLLESIIHSNNDGIINEFSYEYDLLGNKTKVNKRRTSSRRDNGSYEYGYDPLGRLHTVSNNHSPLRTYQYDAYGNRTGMEDYSDNLSTPAKTRYEYNSLNQLISKADSFGVERYSYDNRGNLSSVILDGALKNTYLYGAINRLEQATNAKGEIAKYLYNGLGNRIGKKIGTIPVGNAFPTEPGRPSPIDFSPERSIDYVVDLTRGYNNLLTKIEAEKTYNYAFDTGVLLKGGESFLVNALTSPVEKIGSNGDILASTAYDEFGMEIGGHADEDFTFIGYQRDNIAETYFAQAREYSPLKGRFESRDKIEGFIDTPLLYNLYLYAIAKPLDKTDKTGYWFGIDDLIAASIGVIGGVATTFIGDCIHGITTGDFQLSSWQEYVGSAVGGAVGGVTTLYAGPVAGGAVAGGVTTLTSEGIKKFTEPGYNKSWGSIIGDTVINAGIGAAFGYISDKASTFISDKLSNSTNRVARKIGSILDGGFDNANGEDLRLAKFWKGKSQNARRAYYRKKYGKLFAYYRARYFGEFIDAIDDELWKILLNQPLEQLQEPISEGLCPIGN